MYYYSHNIGDFDRATRHLTRIERSIYRDLLDVYYDTEKPLTLDRAALCRKIIARSDEEVTAVEQVLNEFFTETATGWFHSRCEEEIAAYRASNSQKSAAGKASAAARAARKQQAINASSTSVETAVQTDDSTDVPTTVEQASNGSATKQEPVTVNRKPETKKDKAPPVGDVDLFPGVDPQVVADFKALRKQKRAPITQTAMDKITREAGKAGMTLEAALRVCCARGWQGFESEWVQRGDDRRTTERRDGAFPTLGRAGQATALAAQRLLERDGDVDEG